MQKNPTLLETNQNQNNLESRSSSSDLATKIANENVKKIAINNKKSSSSSVRSITLISINTCLLYLIGQAPYFVSYILSFIITTSPKWFSTYQYITACILMLTHGLTFFIYFKYNKMYRNILKSYARIFLCKN